MTANEMANLLDEKVDRVSSFGSPGYEDFDYTSVLSEAQQLYVKKFFDEVNNRKGKGFEEIEIRNIRMNYPNSTITNYKQIR